MKIVQVISKTVEVSYYDRQITNRTVTTFVSDELSPEEIEIVKENACRDLEAFPVKVIPVA